MENLNLHAVTPIPRTPESTGVLEIMDLTGDTKVHWTAGNAGEVAAARASYDVLKGKGYVAYKLNSDGTTGELIRDFDPSAERIVMRPQMAGG